MTESCDLNVVVRLMRNCSEQPYCEDVINGVIGLTAKIGAGVEHRRKLIVPD